jgi:NAD(P)H-dependent FMN reductase
MKIQIILGSTRQNRVGDKVAHWVLKQAQKKKDVEFELLDLRDYALPFFDEPMPPMVLNGKYSNPVAQKWAEKVNEGDGYILVTPEYNHGYPAVLKNALDYAYHEWSQKPVGFVGYSGTATGGIRAIEQLIPIAFQLKMVMFGSNVVIPEAFKLINEKGEFDGEKFEEQTSKFLDQLITLGKTFQEIRKVK